MVLISVLYSSSEHEQSCQYAPIQCPNSTLCPAVLKMVQKAFNCHIHSISYA